MLISPMSPASHSFPTVLTRPALQMSPFTVGIIAFGDQVCTSKQALILPSCGQRPHLLLVTGSFVCSNHDTLMVLDAPASILSYTGHLKPCDVQAERQCIQTLRLSHFDFAGCLAS